MEGKRALVTGASRGIGLAISEALIKKGVKVVGLGKSKENLDQFKLKFPQTETVCVDLSDWTATKEAVSKLGHFDILINNAGMGKRVPFLEMDHDLIDKMFATNLKAVINVSQIIAKQMKEKGTGGSIINVSSVGAQKAYKNMTAYCSSKAALDQLTKTMALELGPLNIRVNAVSPGIVATDMAQNFMNRPDLVQRAFATIPLGRFSEPVDVANVVLFLLSDEAFIVNGVVLPIDGGTLTH